MSKTNVSQRFLLASKVYNYIWWNFKDYLSQENFDVETPAYVRSTYLEIPPLVYTVFMEKERGELRIDIKERKIRKVGNSFVITVSKQFLELAGIQVGESVFVDEEKLIDAITRKNTDKEFDMLVAQSLQEYDELYKGLIEQ